MVIQNSVLRMIWGKTFLLCTPTMNGTSCEKCNTSANENIKTIKNETCEKNSMIFLWKKFLKIILVWKIESNKGVENQKSK